MTNWYGIALFLLVMVTVLFVIWNFGCYWFAFVWVNLETIFVSVSIFIFGYTVFFDWTSFKTSDFIRCLFSVFSPGERSWIRIQNENAIGCFIYAVNGIYSLKFDCFSMAFVIVQVNWSWFYAAFVPSCFLSDWIRT